ncbi:right-handed parallel beta-helix repeat-containing protein [Actinoplanes solisilvae]|uniref:right-handed parallel beta-helix repeat-containing protein n=1 Tax=Actinoplanes solisilvae TaxID=2486853 RepID=UPI000FDA4E0C|nr:right-handed parallel beta-helix repeat-containing protein [Actinoplanes solisilvae]
MPSRRVRLPLVLAAAAIPLIVAGPSSAAVVPDGGTPPTLAATAPANAVHVSCKTGNDHNPGTPAKPLRSLSAATSRAAGKVIALARGCTWATTVNLRGDGTRLTAYGSGSLPVIDGRSAGLRSVVLLAGRNQVIENVRVTNAQANGVEIRGANSRVRASTIDHVGVGVAFKGSGGVAERVTVRNLHMIRNTPGGNDDYGATGFAVEASGVEIGYSSCTDCRATSHDYGHDGGFVEVWNYADDLDVHHNTGSNTEGILEIGGDRSSSSARGIKLRHNTFRDSHGGVVLHTDGKFAIADAQIAVTANTITSTGTQDPPILSGDARRVTFEGNRISTASVVSNTTPARHRCNSITLRKGAALGYPRHSTERLDGKAPCS